MPDGDIAPVPMSSRILLRVEHFQGLLRWNLGQSESLARSENLIETIDIGVLAGVGAGIVGVFGKNFERRRRSFRSDRTIDLSQVVVDLDRPGLAWLVLDGIDDGAVGAEHIDGGKMVDRGQGGEILGESHGDQITCRGRQSLLRATASDE